jgi:membrane-bound lytic murein transglycosylase A
MGVAILVRYEPIGKYLKDRIAPYPVTMQRIEAVTKSMSQHERDKLFAKNPSYVFFTKSKRRAITSLGVPATPGRTIAVDSKYAPKGSPMSLVAGTSETNRSDPICCRAYALADSVGT